MSGFLAFTAVIGSAIFGYTKLPDEFSFFKGDAVSSDNPLLYIDYAADEAEQTIKNPSSAINQGEYNAKLKILGFLPIKDVTIKVVEKQKLVACGFPFGIKLYTDGVLVVGTGDFLSSGLYCNPAYKAGIRIGDRLVSYGGEKISSNEQLTELVNKQNGKPQTAVIIRKNLKFEAQITPQKDDTTDTYHIGLWVRDSSAGIGTLTYYNPETKTFAGLGHSITDVDTGQTLSAAGGEFVAAEIQDIVKGVSGTPGELRGMFCSETLGVLTANTEQGLYGKGEIAALEEAETMEIALKNEIKVGKAYILTCLDGKTPERYEIEIEKINNNLQQNRNMNIRITDPDLLAKTGGIVQGMSGSPIIQNGKIVGAVTHVFVNDPTKGYGIFIENMLSAS